MKLTDKNVGARVKVVDPNFIPGTTHTEIYRFCQTNKLEYALISETTYRCLFNSTTLQDVNAKINFLTKGDCVFSVIVDEYIITGE